MSRSGVAWLAVAALVVSACSKTEAPPAAPRPVVVMTVADQASDALQIYSGEVRARHETDLSFRVGGKVIERAFNLGDKVKKGQALARIDAQDARLSLTASDAQVKAAEADVALARAELERAQNLASQKFISGSVLDTRRTQLDAAQAKLRQAQAQAGVSGNQLGYTTLVADRDGVITAAPVESGQVVAAGQAVARLADPAQLEILTWVPEARVASIKPGQSALVRPWNEQDKTLPGSVRELAASADTATRTYAVRVAVPQPQGALSLGATAAVAFESASESRASIISLPLPAVVGKGTTAQVWVVAADNTVKARKVEVADYRDEQALIRSGVKAGDRVVTLGAHLLAEGMAVQPVDAKAPVALDVKR